MRRPPNSFWLFLIAAIEVLFPLRFAQAKGGFFGGPIFSIILTVALVAVSVVLAQPELVGLTTEEIGVSSIPEAIGAGMDSVASAVGIGGTTFAADGAALYASSAFEAFSIADTALSLGTAATCLSGSDAFPYSGCGGSSGSNSSSNTQAALQANTVTKQTQKSGPTYTCPDGYYLDTNINQCVGEGYVSCASAGHPELVCPNNTTCTANGQCQGSSVSGGSCNADNGSACSSAPNSCGMTNQGTYECNGSCPAITPSDSSCVAPTISISEEPSLVNPGNECTVSWTVQNATLCTLSSNGADPSLPKSATIPNSSYSSPPLNAATTYTLSCMNGKVVSSQLSVTCHINPQFNEI